MSGSATSRAAKRRKLDNNASLSGSKTTPSNSPSVLRRLSTAANHISKRLFESATDTVNGPGKGDEHPDSNADSSQKRALEHSYSDNGDPDELDGSIEVQSRGKESSHRRKDVHEDSTSKKDGIELNEETQLGDEITVRSSGRQRKRPRRFSNELEEATEIKKRTTKPSRPKVESRTPRQKKDLIGISDTQTDSIGKELGFKDINESSRKKGGKVRQNVAEDQQRHLDRPNEDQKEDLVVHSGKNPKEVQGIDEIPPIIDSTPQKSKRKAKDILKKVPESVVTEADQDLPDPTEVIAEAPPLLETPDICPEVLDEVLDVDEETRIAFGTVQQLVVSRLTGRRRIPLVGLDEDFRKAQQVAEQTVVAGEGNSMLIIGPRGSGKTTMVETIVSDLQKRHAEDFHVVRLNGFLQTDDRLALREIWRQLGREMDVEDDASKINSYADTMASLLALLSHPEELSAAVDVDTMSKSIIFIIDEFDLFTSHPRQTLLYNLFDIAQARKAPIAVFGLSTKVDVAEHLEKRVKSRFSHRYIYLSHAKHLSVFSDMCKSALLVHDSDMASFGDPDDKLLSAQKTWNTYLETLLASPEVNKLIRAEFTLSKSLPALFACFMAAISAVSFLPSSFPTPKSLATSSSQLQPPEAHLSSLSDLPSLTLSLLIAASRLEPLLGTPQCNFNMAYHEYVSLCSRSRLQSSALTGGMGNAGGIRVWGREVARRAWEELEYGSWIIPVSGAEGRLGWAGDGREERMYRVDVTLEEIEALCFQEDREGGLGKVEKSWCREF